MDLNKMNPELKLALRYESLFNEREKRLFIDENTGLWRLIMVYTTTIEEVTQQVELESYALGSNYAEIMIAKEKIGPLSDLPIIVFLGTPIRMNYTDIGLGSICAATINNPVGGFGVTGRGVLIAVIDSGIDYTSPDFIEESGETRIAYLWDQSVKGQPPAGFPIGVEYNSQMINEALALGETEGLKKVPEIDETGHGTTLARIAAGNGRMLGSGTRGVAPRSDLVIVKLAESGGGGFPTDLEIMQGIKYVLEKAKELQKPVSILIGSGENLSAHNGTSILEQYIDLMSYTWICNMTVGTGNQGNRSTHTANQLAEGESQIVQLVIEGNLPQYALSIWYSFSDDLSIRVIAPDNEQTDELDLTTPLRAYLFQNTAVLISISQPLKSQGRRHIYILLQAQDNIRITEGIWTLQLKGQQVLIGSYNAWSAILPDLDNRTRFLNATLERTLVAPSTSKSITSAAAINGNTLQLAPFSGRGYVNEFSVKPDLAAPGVAIPAKIEEGVLSTFSGTSASAAFVAGAYALLMEYGIVQLGNLSLYGETLKYILLSNAQRVPSQAPYPNYSWGYGRLCIEKALNALREGANNI